MDTTTENQTSANQLANLLDDCSAAILRHIIMAPEAVTATTLWIASTYCYERFSHSPRLSITAPTRQCGKSTLLQFLKRTCAVPEEAESVTGAVVFRLIETRPRLTFLLDEVDTYLKYNRDLIGIINAGYAQDGTVLRNVEVDGDWIPTGFRVFCPIALAGIGKPPPTIMDRSIPILLRRKTKQEVVQKFRANGNLGRLGKLAGALAQWFETSAESLPENPAIPDCLSDRQGDICVPLLSIADAAGPVWGKKARTALVAVLRNHMAAEGEEDPGLMLLHDIRAIFGKDTDKLGSANLTKSLHDIEDRPWNEWGRGRQPLSQYQLAELLREYGIQTKPIRIVNEVKRGYERGQFVEAWGRYLGPGGAPS